MKIREAIDRVQSLYSKGAASDDTRLSSRHIYSKLKSARSFLLNRELNKNKKLSERNIEYLECIPLIKALPYECPCIPALGCTILKTECKIPKFVSNKRGDYIISVNSIDGEYHFSPTTFEDKKYKAFNKYTKNAIDYFTKNDYLYVTSKELIPAITVAGIFDDTTDFNCNSCCEESTKCEDIRDKEFKVDSYLTEPIIELAFQELINQFSRIPEDLENDSKDK
jgi:hypothetical protein